MAPSPRDGNICSIFYSSWSSFNEFYEFLFVSEIIIHIKANSCKRVYIFLKYGVSIGRFIDTGTENKIKPINLSGQTIHFYWKWKFKFISEKITQLRKIVTRTFFVETFKSLFDTFEWERLWIRQALRFFIFYFYKLFASSRVFPLLCYLSILRRSLISLRINVQRIKVKMMAFSDLEANKRIHG